MPKIYITLNTTIYNILFSLLYIDVNYIDTLPSDFYTIEVIEGFITKANLKLKGNIKITPAILYL